MYDCPSAYEVILKDIGKISRGYFYWHGLTLIPAWISNHIPSKMWDEITYPFPNITGPTIEVWEWIGSSIPHLIMNVITYPHWDKGPQGGRFKNTYELLNVRALKISKLHKNHIFQCMGKIFCVEFQRVPLKFHTKYLTHTLKDVDFIHIWKFKSSLI